MQHHVVGGQAQVQPEAEGQGQVQPGPGGHNVIQAAGMGMRRRIGSSLGLGIVRVDKVSIEIFQAKKYQSFHKYDV